MSARSSFQHSERYRLLLVFSGGPPREHSAIQDTGWYDTMVFKPFRELV